MWYTPTQLMTICHNCKRWLISFITRYSINQANIFMLLCSLVQKLTVTTTSPAHQGSMQLCFANTKHSLGNQGSVNPTKLSFRMERWVHNTESSLFQTHGNYGQNIKRWTQNGVARKKSNNFLHFWSESKPGYPGWGMLVYKYSEQVEGKKPGPLPKAKA